MNQDEPIPRLYHLYDGTPTTSPLGLAPWERETPNGRLDDASTMTENRLKISSPERIARVLRRICQASLQVMVRASEQSPTTVKGRATNLIMDANVPRLRIANISDQGVQYLKDKGKVQVEFIMMSTKVVFVSQIVGREQNSLLVRMPQSLVSIERRKITRYSCTDDLMAFLKLSIWNPDPRDSTAPPYFPPYDSLSSHVPVADLSFGGLCAVTRFPAIGRVLRRGLIDDKATLVLPMQKPVNVGVEVRWFKKIREHINTDQSKSYTRSYRFGVEFKSDAEELRLGIRQFIQQLNQQGAI